MRYLFKSTYTPTDPGSDRRRAGTVVLDHDSPLTAIPAALSSLEMSGLTSDALYEWDRLQRRFRQVGDEDTIHRLDSEGWAWEVHSNNGEYHFEIEPFEAEDPVDKEAIRVWAYAEAFKVTVVAAEPKTDEDAAREILYCLLGRWYWRNIDQWSSHDLKEALHDLAVEGSDSTPYAKMTLDQLLDAVLDEIVEHQEGMYDEVREGKPFGMALMVSHDTSLWLDED